jgi:hypothetical protein
MRRFTTKEGAIMTKSLLTGMAALAALAVLAGSANAHVKKSRIHAAMTASPQSWLTVKGGPLHDCVHVTFPQCNSHEFGGPND